MGPSSGADGIPAHALLIVCLQRRRQEAVRLAVLELLDAAPAYKAPAHVLRDTLADAGLGMPLDDLATQLAWLADAELIELQAGGGIAVLRMAGADVAHGLKTVDGVQRPQPAA